MRAEAHLDGAGIGLAWVLPFAGTLLSIAVLPLIAPRFWEHHFGKIALLQRDGMVVPAWF